MIAFLRFIAVMMTFMVQQSHGNFVEEPIALKFDWDAWDQCRDTVLWICGEHNYEEHPDYARYCSSFKGLQVVTAGAESVNGLFLGCIIQPPYPHGLVDSANITASAPGRNETSKPYIDITLKDLVREGDATEVDLIWRDSYGYTLHVSDGLGVVDARAFSDFRDISCLQVNTFTNNHKTIHLKVEDVCDINVVNTETGLIPSV